MGLLLLAALLLQEERPPDDPQRINGWIGELASDRIEVRDEASKKLLEAGDFAIPFLKKSLDQTDPELRARCRDILAKLEFAKTKVEPGARQLAGVGKDVPDMRPNPEKKATFEDLLKRGKIKDVVADDFIWLTYVFDGILSDEKAVAEGSLRALHEIIKKRAIPVTATDLVSKPDMKVFYSAEMRAAEYSYWAQWWFTKSARDFVADWDGPPPEDRITDWVEALKILRSGQGLQDADSQAARLMKKVRSMEKSAYPILIRFIDDDDLAVGTTAVRLLQDLTGRESKALTEKNKAELRKDWGAWLESKN